MEWTNWVAAGWLLIAVGLLVVVLCACGPDRVKEWREERRAAAQRRKDQECVLCHRPRVDGDTLCWLHKWGGEDV